MTERDTMLVVPASRGEPDIAKTPSSDFMQGGAIQAYKCLWHSKSNVSNLDIWLLDFAMMNGIIRTSAS